MSDNQKTPQHNEITNNKTCYVCRRTQPEIEEIVSVKMLETPKIIFNIINLGRENIRLCCVCQMTFEKLFNDVMSPFLQPIFERVLDTPLTQFITFVQSFVQAIEMAVVEFGFTAIPKTDRDRTPPTEIDFNPTDNEIKNFIIKIVRGYSHILSSHGIVLKHIPKPREIDFPSNVPKPEDV